MILIDSNIFIAYLNKRDKNHLLARDLVNNLLKGKYGLRFSISDVFSEISTILFRQTKNKKIIETAWNLFYDPNQAWVTPIIITKEIINQGWTIYQKFLTIKRPLSFVDCLIIATAKERSIEHVASFDAEFDGILSRINS